MPSNDVCDDNVPYAPPKKRLNLSTGNFQKARRIPRRDKMLCRKGDIGLARL